MSVPLEGGDHGHNKERKGSQQQQTTSTLFASCLAGQLNQAVLGVICNMWEHALTCVKAAA